MIWRFPEFLNRIKEVVKMLIKVKNLKEKILLDNKKLVLIKKMFILICKVLKKNLRRKSLVIDNL